MSGIGHPLAWETLVDYWAGDLDPVQLDALELSLAVGVEQAQFDLGGMRRKDREIDAEPIPGRTERERPAFGHLGPAQVCRRLHQCVAAVGRLIHDVPLLRRSSQASRSWCSAR